MYGGFYVKVVCCRKRRERDRERMKVAYESNFCSHLKVIIIASSAVVDTFCYSSSTVDV